MACDMTALHPSGFPVRTLHIADPANPRVAVSAGPGHFRFEFLRLPHEDPAAFDSAASAWRRLASFGVDPGNATLERFAVYRIRSRCAERWRSGRLLIAGDAAHEMPPFAGQGLSSGIADAAALAWRLSAVVDGAGDAVLDSYAAERLPRVRRSIDTSVRLGALICTTDRAAAAARDAAMLRSAGRTPPPPPDSITTGVLHRTPAGGPARFAGRLAPQLRAAPDSGLGLRHVLLATETLAAELGELGIPVVAVQDGYADWLASLGDAKAALVRPDFYVFGVASDRDALAAMVNDLDRQLSSVG
jgi:flavoprotein hydroxylase